MESSKKAVTILTGFLGAGKTSFLNHLLQENHGTRYAIIENEFGEQGIDSELVIRPDDNIVELNNGCLCCTLNDNLYEILSELFDRRNEFDQIIIEATGVADPTGLAEPFVSHPLIKKHFPLKGIICMVDAELIESQLIETEEAKNQIAYSDILLINKTDLVNEGQVSELEKKLQKLNPLADVVRGNKNAFPKIDLSSKESPLDRIFQKTDKDTFEGEALQFPIKKPHSHHHHKHTEEIVSHTFHFDQAFDYQLFDRHLFVYLMLQSQGLYRMKGLVWLEGSEDQYVVQSVGSRLDIEKKRAWEIGEERKSVMVFIGKNIQRQGLEKLLNKCISKRSSTQY
ncbi:MAG: GTP-binding protein [Bacteroidia bacterium]|nr:GTP-binding protein [Bacteroidia bacterium]